MAPSGSYFIDRAAAEKAVALSLPMMHEAMKLKEVGESGFLYIVVMDPLLGPAPVPSKKRFCISIPSATASANGVKSCKHAYVELQDLIPFTR